MKSRRLLMNCILVATAATLWSGTAFAQTADDDQVCDPHAADAADNPDCAGQLGPHCDYADTCGTAETCGTATTCDTATTCQYADTCGDAATCDNATTCDTATTAAHCDTATTADSCGSATTATYAETVGECTTGVFSVGGGASPNCGDLRYDGRLGINTDPTAALDVAGPVELRGAAGQTGLVVDGGGAVGVGIDPTHALDVDGIIVADQFQELGNPPARPETYKVKIVTPATDCRIGSQQQYTPDGRVSFVDLQCGIALEEDAHISHVECFGWGNADITLMRRGVDFVVHDEWTTSGSLGSSPAIFVNDSVTERNALILRFESTMTGPDNPRLYGCRVNYEVNR